MLSLNFKSLNYVMTQILKLICVSFSYVSISYVLAETPCMTEKFYYEINLNTLYVFKILLTSRSFSLRSSFSVSLKNEKKNTYFRRPKIEM